MADIPTAVYRLYGEADALLYVGVAKNPETRLRRHKLTKAWWPQVAKREVEWHPSRDAALLAEAGAIADENPVHNIVVPDPENPWTWPPADWAEYQAEGVRRSMQERKAATPCPDCGQPMPPAKTCARQECGNEFRFRRADAVYCSERCARIMAQRALRRREATL